MPTTRASLEFAIVRRCGRTLAAAGLDGSTADGTNPDLLDPIASACRSAGLAMLDPSTPSPAELAALPASSLDLVLDVAEARALESALGNWDQPDQVADTDSSQALGKLRDSIERTVARKLARLEKLYGIGEAPLAAGSIDLGFVERCPWPGGWGAGA